MPPKNTYHVPTAHQKKRKATKGSSSRSQPAVQQDENLVLNFDQNRFLSEIAQERFNQNIMGRGLLPERRIELKPGEYDHISEELARRKWNHLLANLPDEIDEVLVKEFYANAWDPEQAQTPSTRASTVRGKLIRYDRKALNRLLHTLMFIPCPLGTFMSGHPDHDLIASTLCLPGYGYQLGTSGTPVRILRKHLNSVATIWSTFSFTSPNSHTSDINLERSYLIYGIMTGISMDIGAFISQELSLMANNDSCKLGFPALVTALCKANGVAGVSDITLKLQPPLNKRFFDRNCVNRGESSGTDAPPPVPPPRRRAVRPPTSSHTAPPSDLHTDYMIQSMARMEDIRDWCYTMRQGQVSLQDSMYQLSLGTPGVLEDSVMNGDQFLEHIPWPEDRPESRWGRAFPAYTTAPQTEYQHEDMTADDEGHEEPEEPDPRWMQQSQHTQHSHWRSGPDGSW